MTGLLTTQEAAQQLGLTRQAIHLWIKQGRINAFQMLGGRWAIYQSEINRIKKQREKRAAA